MSLHLTEQDLASSFLLWYLVTKYPKGWRPEKRIRGGYSGKCLWHQEHTGSMGCYSDHIHCYGGGCGVHGDSAQVIGVLEYGLDFEEKLTADVFWRYEQLLEEFTQAGGSAEALQCLQRQTAGITRLRKALSIPGPLHRRVLTQVTDWWHEQLLADTSQARSVRNYVRDRGVSDRVIRQCAVLGYMPYDEDLHWSQARVFDRLYQVSEQDLEEERQWYRQHVAGESLTDEYLDFLATPQAFARRLGLINESGRWRLAGRLIFSCQNGKATRETRFYQGRLLPWSNQKQSKFLNPPGITKYFFQVTLDMLAPDLTPLQPGTIQTESPFGPLVAISHRLCYRGIATLGESTPQQGHLIGLEEPIWLAQDNDMAQVTSEGRIVFPGEEQARLSARFYTSQQMQSIRLLPWKQYKGFDEWTTGMGGSFVSATMTALLATPPEKLSDVRVYGMI